MKTKEMLLTLMVLSLIAILFTPQDRPGLIGTFIVIAAFLAAILWKIK